MKRREPVYSICHLFYSLRPLPTRIRRFFKKGYFCLRLENCVFEMLNFARAHVYMKTAFSEVFQKYSKSVFEKLSFS